MYRRQRRLLDDGRLGKVDFIVLVLLGLGNRLRGLLQGEDKGKGKGKGVEKGVEEGRIRRIFGWSVCCERQGWEHYCRLSLIRRCCEEI